MSISHTSVAAVLAALLALTGAAARAGEAPPAPAAPSGPAVSPLTVRPETQAQGKVVSSSEARPLAAPNFTAEDARPDPLAVVVAPNAALGRQAPPPSGAPGGLLNTNPDLPGGFRSDDVGVTVVF